VFFLFFVLAICFPKYHFRCFLHLGVFFFLFFNLPSSAGREIVFSPEPLSIHLSVSWEAPSLSLVLPVYLFYSLLLYSGIFANGGKINWKLRTGVFFLSDFIAFALTFDINWVGIKVVMDFFFFFCGKKKFVLIYLLIFLYSSS